MPNASTRIRSIKSLGPATAIVALLFAAGPAQAAGVIKQPGNHPKYSVEIEPHFLLHWDQRPWYGEGFGLGARFSIPFLDNGPIKTINNNMAIGFGLDWAHFSESNTWCWDRNYWRADPRYGYYAGYNCSSNAIWVPVVLQWNFFLTDVISVFGEPGFAIHHDWWDGYYPCGNTVCPVNASDTSVAFVMWGGARFMFSDTVGAVVRLGTPSLTAGITFLL